MTLNEALLRGFAAAVVVVGGVMGLAALEAVLLKPERGALSMFSRARSQLLGRSHLGAEGVAGIAGLVFAMLGPAVAAAFLATSLSLSALSASALLLAMPAPVLLALGTGSDARARLALHDALAQLTRRALAVVAVVVVAGAPSSDPAGVVVVVVVTVAIIVLVHSRHRGAPTAQPRFDDRLAGPAFVAWRVADRAVVVVAAALAGNAIYERTALWITAPVVVVVVAVAGVGVARALGPLRGEAVGGPLFLLVLAGCARGVIALLG